MFKKQSLKGSYAYRCSQLKNIDAEGVGYGFIDS